MKLNYHQYLLLDDATAVELSDDRDLLWLLESRDVDVPNVHRAKHTHRHWCKHKLDEINQEASLTYNQLLEAECQSEKPLTVYTYTVEDVVHRLSRYAEHMVYHLTAPKLQLERVVVAPNETVLVNHRYGIGALYYCLLAATA